MSAVSLLEEMWLDVTIHGSRLGALILWNAMYHLEVQSGGHFRIPSFDQRWAATKTVYCD